MANRNIVLANYLQKYNLYLCFKVISDKSERLHTSNFKKSDLVNRMRDNLKDFMKTRPDKSDEINLKSDDLRYFMIYYTFI